MRADSKDERGAGISARPSSPADQEPSASPQGERIFPECPNSNDGDTPFPWRAATAILRAMTALKALYRRLCRSSNAELEKILAAGALPDATQLAGWEFYGYNTGAIAGPLGIRKFKKGFYRRENGRTPVGGYNCKVRPTPLDGPWVNGGAGGAYQGYYDVRPPPEGSPIAEHPNALYLDYGSDPTNSFFSGSFLRDFLVQPDPQEPDVLLGKAYAKVGPLVLPVSFFVLQRANPVTQPASFLH